MLTRLFPPFTSTAPCIRSAPRHGPATLGIKSDRHGPHVGVNVEIVDRDHPITSPLEDWQIAKDELYNNVDVFDAHPLAMGHQTYKNKAGKEVTDAAIVAWTNEKQGARSFSTSLGHFNEVVESKQYLDLVVRGALWACGKLDDPFYHNPYTGSNLVREIAAGQPARPAAKAAPAAPACRRYRRQALRHQHAGREQKFPPQRDRRRCQNPMVR